MFFKKKIKPTTGIQFIICGLGNPGNRYEDTRHNCGFFVIDDLAKKYGEKVKKLKFKSLVGEISINSTVGEYISPMLNLAGVKCLLIKPSTYMNKSGEAIIEAMQFYKLPPSKVLVICDDVNLDVGVIRIREKGSDGGQKGLRNIIMMSNSDEFPRIRIGVGKKPHPDYKLSDWVLSSFKKSEAVPLNFALENSLFAAELIAGGNIIEAMNKYNPMKYDSTIL
jgi:PTH1 family peptidyl-tRNA hydrolase